MSETYEQEVEGIEMSFQYELCAECPRDLDEHAITPDMFGHAHVWCNAPLVEELNHA